MKSKICLLALCAVVALAVVGCKTSPPGGRPVVWNLSITSKTTASIEVDLVGVATSNEESFLNGVSRENYWNDPQIRSDQLKLGNTLTKFLQKDQPWIVSKDDPQWQAWLNRGVFELFIMAQLPEATGNWKVPLRIGRKCWNAKDKTIEIWVVDSGISIQTPPRN